MSSESDAKYYLAHKDRIKERVQAYRATEAGRLVNNRHSTKYNKLYPLKHKAVQEVQKAIQDGRLERPTVCSLCGAESCKIEGHHWSYEEQNWLSVVWCCIPCHSGIHNDKLV